MVCCAQPYCATPPAKDPTEAVFCGLLMLSGLFGTIPITVVVRAQAPRGLTLTHIARAHRAQSPSPARRERRQEHTGQNGDDRHRARTAPRPTVSAVVVLAGADHQIPLGIHASCPALGWLDSGKVARLPGGGEVCRAPR